MIELRTIPQSELLAELKRRRPDFAETLDAIAADPPACFVVASDIEKAIHHAECAAEELADHLSSLHQQLEQFCEAPDPIEWRTH